MPINKPLISFCIPVYNGASTIEKTLDSIIAQKEKHSIEIVISDDCSTDDSIAIIKKYTNKYSYVKLFCNDENIGMDLNFLKSVELANGKFTWLSGQDDIFEKGAIDKFKDVFIKNPEIGAIYFNYKQVDHDFKCILKERLIPIDQDIYLRPENSYEYFDEFGVSPSFLPATVIQKKMWPEKKRLQPFLGTYYVQMAAFILAMSQKSTYFVASSQYVSGRVPNDGWQSNGTRQMNIWIGHFDAIYKLHHMGISNNPISKIYFNRMKNYYILIFFRRMVSWKAIGGNLDRPLKIKLKILFGLKTYFFKFLPVILIPKFIACWIMNLHWSLKKNKKNTLQGSEIQR